MRGADARRGVKSGENKSAETEPTECFFIEFFLLSFFLFSLPSFFVLISPLPPQLPRLKTRWLPGDASNLFKSPSQRTRFAKPVWLQLRPQIKTSRPALAPPSSSAAGPAPRPRNLRGPEPAGQLGKKYGRGNCFHRRITIYLNIC